MIRFFKKQFNKKEENILTHKEEIISDIYNLDISIMKKYLYYDELYNQVVNAVYFQNYSQLPEKLFTLNKFGKLFIKDKDFYLLFQKKEAL